MIVNEIFAAADRKGVGLAEHVRIAYGEGQIADLEKKIKDQLKSLREEISEFMVGIEAESIASNMLTVNKDELDRMQAKVRETMATKMIELTRLNETMLIEEAPDDLSVQDGYESEDCILESACPA